MNWSQDCRASNGKPAGSPQDGVRKPGPGERTLSSRVYKNQGNWPILELLDWHCPRTVLDCGCGAGDNARILNSAGWSVTGITLSNREAQLAQSFCEEVIVADLEHGIPVTKRGRFDVILMAHVLEHLTNPELLLTEAKERLGKQGILAVALPNVLNYRYRLQFLLGSFRYEPDGIMDSTHLRFYTYETGAELLVANGYEILKRQAGGFFPQRPLRRVFPRLTRALDDLAAGTFPGVFGWQLLYLARPR